MHKFFGEQDIIDDSFNEKFSIRQNLFGDLAEKNRQRNTMFESNPLLQYQNDFNNNIEQSNTYSLFSIKTIKKRGRKKRGSNEVGNHNKCSEDNILRKIKIKFLRHSLKFINSIIKKESYTGESMLLKKITSRQSNIYSVEENKIFIHKKLEDIFSDDISTKYKKFDPKYNQKVIEKLINEENLEKKKKFTKLFNITFIEGLEHLCGKKIIEGLEGFGTLDEFIDNYFKKEEEEYKKIIKANILDYEKNIYAKKQRKKREK
jgi:hypothetical protein